MVRLFVAAWPPAAVSARLADLTRSTEPGVRWVPDRNRHLTLRFIGDADAGEVADRLAAATLPRVTATLGPAVEPFGRRLLAVPVEGVDPLAAAVRAATSGIGAEERRRFRGHLSIARLGRDACSSLSGHRLHDEFEVTEITLTNSELGPDGATYTTVARFATT